MTRSDLRSSEALYRAHTEGEPVKPQFSDTRPALYEAKMPRQQRPLGGAFWFVVTVVLVASIAAGVFA